MYISILGRQPALGMAELERLYGSRQTRWFSDISALIDSSDFDFEQLGGSQKAGSVVAELHGSWREASQKIVAAYKEAWSQHDGKITLGISAYGFDIKPRDVQKTGIILKAKLRESGTSLRLIPNADLALNTATSHHNKLGLSPNKVELLVVRATGGKIIVAESLGAQNITAIAARDQARPKTDAFVGMLPPKLARMMVNLATGTTVTPPGHVLDPFCGTGVVLQEAALLGYTSYGTDLSEKMVAYSTANLAWLSTKFKWVQTGVTIQHADAMNHTWQPTLDAIASEAYLGQPFSAPPSSEKLKEVSGNCNHIIGNFLKNIAPQLESGTPLCLAIPAWRSSEGRFTHLALINHLEELGYRRIHLENVRNEQLLYYRDNQVVARQLLLIERS